MIKFKLTFDKDEEQDWLNGLCQAGWALADYRAGFYTFVPCRPGEYIYQIDLLPGSGFRASDPAGYREFMEETGVEVVSQWFRWVFLRKRADDGPFAIYTDPASQIDMYVRIRQMFLWVLVIELFCSISVLNGLIQFDDLFFRLMAGVYALLLIAILRTILRCTGRIRELREK